ncbi:MAG: polysaccharide deacetylase [Acidobacteriota bacterium]
MKYLTLKNFLLILSIIFIIFFAFIKVSAQQEEIPWKFPFDKVQNIVNKVRAGKDLNPKYWPNGAKVAVALSFDFDTETIALRDNRTSPSLLSQGEYGARTGIYRILNLLDKYGIPVSFFIPAISAKLHPTEIKAIMNKKRHEIGMHGWIHERNSLLSEEDEREVMKKAYETLKEITGKAPSGIRTPSWDFSPSTLKIIMELGLIYDSSLMADDKPYEILYEGKSSGIVEIPVEWILDDYPYFGMDRFSPIRPHSTPDDVLSIWKGEFAKAYDEGITFVLTMHPQIIGHRSRILMLEKLIQYIISFQNVWFATHETIANYVRSGR